MRLFILLLAVQVTLSVLLVKDSSQQQIGLAVMFAVENCVHVMLAGIVAYDWQTTWYYRTDGPLVLAARKVRPFPRSSPWLCAILLSMQPVSVLLALFWAQAIAESIGLHLSALALLNTLLISMCVSLITIDVASIVSSEGLIFHSENGGGGGEPESTSEVEDGASGGGGGGNNDNGEFAQVFARELSTSTIRLINSAMRTSNNEKEN